MDDSTRRGEELVRRFQDLHQQGQIALQSGRLGAAEGYFEGAVDVARIFVQIRHDTVWAFALAGSLMELASVLDKLGANPETVPLLEEAAEELRGLTESIPADAESALVTTLIRLAKAYRGPGSYIDLGRSPMHDLSDMKMYRRKRMGDGTWGGMNLTGTSPETQAKAEAPLREVIPLLRRMVRTNRERFEGALALSLNLLGETLIMSAREAEAEAPLREAEALYRKLVIDEPTFESLLSDTLSLLSRIPSDSGTRDRVAILEELACGLRAEAQITIDERDNGMSVAKSGARDRLREVLEELADLYQASGQDEKYREVWRSELGPLMTEVTKIRWDQ